MIHFLKGSFACSIFGRSSFTWKWVTWVTLKSDMFHIFRTHHQYKHQTKMHLLYYIEISVVIYCIIFTGVRNPIPKKWSLSTFLKLHDRHRRGHPIFPNRQLAVVRGLERLRSAKHVLRIHLWVGKKKLRAEWNEFHLNWCWMIHWLVDWKRFTNGFTQ